jgi:branched-subunit amino acid aminotransferase/4-amino-4-deoxychorismate lyase
MSDTTLVWMNGRLLPETEAQISIFDRGFTLGDGLFETLRVKAGRPLWLADHLARFREGAHVLGIPVPFDDGALEGGLMGLIEARGHPDASLRLTMSRGPSQARGIWPPASPVTPTLLATLSPFPGAPRPPIKLVTAQTVRRNEHSPLSRIKSMSYGDNILARREAESRGADDALMMNGKGDVVCATVGNLFLRVGKVWITPPIAHGVLPGTARRRLIPMLGAAERSISPAELARADAGLVSNSLGLVVIGEVDGRALDDITAFAGTMALFEE